MKRISRVFLIFVIFFNITILFAQKSAKNKSSNPEEIVKGLKFRSIGPAFTSGRIADIAVNPQNPSEFYVAVAMGHIWKTEDNGTTFKPVFENYGAYSIGSLAVDPQNPHIVWAGTGENNHQRAIGYGNGIYKSTDGGKTWKNMGLKNSRHIGMINIDPRDSQTVLVAAEGSLWGPGGDRGLYKTTDGGKTWKRVLYISENTGVNNVVRDPSNPDILYATSEQRRRHVFTHISGGPESKVFKSEDGGDTWREIMKGLPKADIGGMGIAVSPANPDIVYLIMEAAEGQSGFYRSADKGESWQKMSDHHSSGQYYNEIYADPIDPDKVYSVETVTHYTEDGGKTWKPLNLKNKHVDDHAMWIDPSNPEHFMIGGDGGLYITYNGGKSYRHIPNLPVVQFYRVYLDNAFPFYNIYGGTQDNNSIGGPSRTIRAEGSVKGDWIVTVGGDGFWGAADPENPDIVYSEYQYGNLFRYDKKSGQRLKIKPMPGKDELTYKWNWNAPFILSPHNNKRLYLAANKLFRSDDRGNSWKVISPDLTAGIDRNTWPVMGKYWSAEAVGKDVSTSLYGTLVSLAESPLKEGWIYTGSDDGVLAITRDGGKTWTRIERFPGIPPHTYISDILPDKFDPQTLYVSFDNRKRDDFKPYILKSEDGGKTWKTLSEGLPSNGTVHTLEQDHVNPQLLFAGTEFGIFFSPDGGKKWIRLKNGIPDIAVRDMAIQKRENDLVLATFGRGFYVLDDYSVLRYLNDDFVKNHQAFLFPVKDAWQYVETHKKYGQGDTEFYGKNPPYGAVIRYYLKEKPRSTTEIRRKKEKELFRKGEKIPQPTWRELEEEQMEEPSYLLFTVKDDQGNVVDKITAKPVSGLGQAVWDLRYANPYPVDRFIKEFDPFKEDKFGVPVLPGTYTVEMALYDKGEYKPLAGPVQFKVKALNNTTFEREKDETYRQYFTDLQRTLKDLAATKNRMADLNKRIVLIKQTLLRTPAAGPDLMKKAQLAEKTMRDLHYIMYGVKPKASYEEIPPHKLPINKRFTEIAWRHISSTDPITQTEKEQLQIVKEQLEEFKKKLNRLETEQVIPIEKQLDALDAPWTPGR